MRSSDRAVRAPATLRRVAGALLVLLGIAGIASPTGAGTSGEVIVLRIDDMINPITERYVAGGIDDARERGAALLLVELDTPGGLLTSTQAITGRLLASDVPVAVYVTPPGARAASAGVFVTMAAHVAAMAPTTRIGAATPVDGGGQEIPDDLRTKIVNDTVAYARSIADARGRNADWAEDAVRDAVVVAADEAVALEVVDLVADDRSALLAEVDGRTVATARGDVVLETAGVPVVEQPMSPFERFFMAIASPDIALLLLSLGGLALYFELANPGAIFPGVVGVIFLVLAFVSLGTLPISAAGLALLLIGMVLLGAEIFVASGGILGVGGVAAFALGGLLLIDDAQAPFLEVSRPLIVGLTLSMGGFVLFAMGAVVRARSRVVAVGGDDLVGRIGRVRGRDVFVSGELWRAERLSGSALDLPADAGVRVVGRRGLVLQVEPVEPPPPSSSTESRPNP